MEKVINELRELANSIERGELAVIKHFCERRETAEGEVTLRVHAKPPQPKPVQRRRRGS